VEEGWCDEVVVGDVKVRRAGVGDERHATMNTKMNYKTGTLQMMMMTTRTRQSGFVTLSCRRPRSTTVSIRDHTPVVPRAKQAQAQATATVQKRLHVADFVATFAGRMQDRRQSRSSYPSRTLSPELPRRRRRKGSPMSSHQRTVMRPIVTAAVGRLGTSSSSIGGRNL
jgi:hypothetical protein